VNIVRRHDLDRLNGRCILVVTPHADDPALFVGGTIALMTECGAQVHYLRITKDETDSVGLSAEATELAIDGELAQAAAHLGFQSVTNLGYPSDRLSDVPLTELREHVIRVFRQLRPYAVLSFDPYSAYGEDNSDHVRTAQAVDEAYWTAMFDKHHPEHLAAGLTPHGVVERWYFGRRVTQVTHVVDISQTLQRRVDAAVAHRTMLGHMVNQVALFATTAGRDIGDVSELIQNPEPLVRAIVPATAASTGSAYDLDAAEEFRIVEYAGMGAVIDYLEQRQRGETS